MKTRSVGTPKSGAKKTPPVKKAAATATVASPDASTGSAASKKTPPVRKAASGTPVTSPEPGKEPATPKVGETARTSATKAKQLKSKDTPPAAATAAASGTASAAADSKPGPPVVEPKEVGGADQAAPKKTVRTRTVVRRVVRKTKASNVPKAASVQSPETEDAKTPNTMGAAPMQSPKAEDTKLLSPKAENAEPSSAAKLDSIQSPNSEDAKMSSLTKEASVQSPKTEEILKAKVEDDLQKEEEVGAAKSVESAKEEELTTEAGKSIGAETTVKVEEYATANVGEEEEEPMEQEGLMEEGEPMENEEPVEEEEPMEMEEHNHLDDELVRHDTIQEEVKNEEDKEDNMIEPANMEEVKNVDDGHERDDVNPEDEDPGNKGVEERGKEVLEDTAEVEDDAAEPGDEVEPEEHRELTVHAEERSVKRELEIYVGGLDRDASQDDVKKAFEKVGEIVEVRLHKDMSNNKNKAYAFVRFATKEQAKRALSDVKNPMICGKRCGTAPSEDDNTLFLGNICNTWTKEAIKQKMKDYNIEGVEHITLVADPRHEGLSRGFAFVEFACHADALLAYKRLQKPDVIFGHAERTAKVAFAEPIREPDPKIMAQVKSVFIDGLPPHWDEDRVKEQFKGYGEIEKIVLARNMSTAKRKDFGFVDFTNHDAAVACIDDINTKELADGNSKIKVKARLSNPLPKTQAVKGGMCGGFRIGRGIGGSTQHGKGQPSNRANIQRRRGFYPHELGQPSGMGFVGERDFDHPYADFHGRQFFGPGGRRGGIAQTRYDGATHGVTGGGYGRHYSSRGPPFSHDGGFRRPFTEGHFDDPYLYDDAPHGIKRPHYMTDPAYVEPSRLRPRMDYSDPAVSYRDTHYRGGGMYSRDYYGSDYGGAYSSYYGADQPYRSGYY